MKLRYETGTATLIHFLFMVFFGFLNTIVSIFEACKDASVSSCVQDSGISLIFLLILIGWFGFLSILGYAAQEKRNHKLAFLLMGAEAMVFLIAVFNAQHFPNILGLITSLVDAAFALWIITLAFRLIRAKGGRITTAKNRARRRVVANR